MLIDQSICRDFAPPILDISAGLVIVKAGFGPLQKSILQNGVFYEKSCTPYAPFCTPCPPALVKSAKNTFLGVAIYFNSLGWVILELNRPMRAEIKAEVLLFLVVNFGRG